MYYSGIHNLDVANGPGIRVSLFVSGCPHHCIYCFNKDTWSYDYGTLFDKKSMNTLLEMLSNPAIKGFTLLGGEPFSPNNQAECAKILKTIKDTYPQKQIWCFTGYLFEKEILNNMCNKYESTIEMLKYIDVLVDGPFLQTYKNPSLKFKGSENQKTIDVQASIKENKEILLEGFNDDLVILSDGTLNILKEKETKDFINEQKKA